MFHAMTRIVVFNILLPGIISFLCCMFCLWMGIKIGRLRFKLRVAEAYMRGFDSGYSLGISHEKQMSKVDEILARSTEVVTVPLLNQPAQPEQRNNGFHQADS